MEAARDDDVSVNLGIVGDFCATVGWVNDE
jgi:hypothetical protein